MHIEQDQTPENPDNRNQQEPQPEGSLPEFPVQQPISVHNSEKVDRVAGRIGEALEAVFEAVEGIDLSEARYARTGTDDDLPAGQMMIDQPGLRRTAWIDSSVYERLLVEHKRAEQNGGIAIPETYFVRLYSPFTQSVEPADSSYPEFYSAILSREFPAESDRADWELVVYRSGTPEVTYASEEEAIGVMHAMAYHLIDAAEDVSVNR